MATYRSALDREQGLLVVIFQAELNKEEEEPFIAQVESLYADRVNLSRDLVALNVIAEGVLSGGGPTFRKRIAESRKRMLDAERALGATRRTLLAVVTGSTLVRAAATALDWLHPPPPQLQQGFFPKAEPAIAWCEQQRGEPLPRLRTMYARLSSQTGRHRALGSD